MRIRVGTRTMRNAVKPQQNASWAQYPEDDTSEYWLPTRCCVGQRAGRVIQPGQEILRSPFPLEDQSSPRNRHTTCRGSGESTPSTAAGEC
jgi:hypothetical protein